MSKETHGKPGEIENPQPPRRRRVFRNFAEYWHYVKVLSQSQREVLVQSLSIDERKALQASFKRGGWNDLMMRNTCDQILAAITDQTEVDFLDVRMKVIFGKPQLIQKGLWEHINKCFGKIPWEHVAYIFDGIIAEEYDSDYLKLTHYNQ